MTPGEPPNLAAVIEALAQGQRVQSAQIAALMGATAPAAPPAAAPSPATPWWQSSAAALFVGLLVMGGGASLGGLFRIPQIEDTANRTVLALTELRRAFESDVRTVRDDTRTNALRLDQFDRTLTERQQVIVAGQAQLRDLQNALTSNTLSLERLRAETDLGRRELDGRLAAMAREAEAALVRQADKDANILRSIATNREEGVRRDAELRETLNGLLRDLPSSGRRTTLAPGDASTDLPDPLPRPPTREARAP